MARKARQVNHQLTDEQKTRHAQAREAIDEELPDLVRRGQQLRKAAQESTLSGELRRAIHSHALTLGQIADRAGLSMDELEEFLAGDRTLTSDIIDRLADAVGCKLTRDGAPVTAEVN